MVLGQDQAEQLRQPLVEGLTKEGQTEAATLVAGLKTEILTAILNMAISRFKDWLSQPGSVDQIFQIILGFFKK